MIETERIEFKKNLNDKLEKEVVGFLNTKHGGMIYIGIDADGKVVGVSDIDKTELEIKDRIKQNISPSTTGLFEIITLEEADKRYIQIIISGGNQQPYYIKKFGMSSEGCYIRIGTSVEKMTDDLIMDLFQKREKKILTNILSPIKQLTFDFLIEKYREKGYEIGKNLLQQLEFYTMDNQFNYVAFLFSEQNNLLFQYARYSNEDVFDLIEQKTFTNQSILKSALEIIDFLQMRNITYTKIVPNGREDIKKFNPIALREIVVNAIVHNDYRTNGLPTFEEFPNRFEISSFGGLPNGFTREDFLNGYSLPVNPTIIRIFRDLGLAERLSTGIRRVLKYYPKEIFKFSPNFIRVNIPFKTTNDIDEQPTILNLLKNNPYLTRKELAKSLAKSESTVYRELALLEKNGYIKRIGSNKNGFWKVIIK